MDMRSVQCFGQDVLTQGKEQHWEMTIVRRLVGPKVTTYTKNWRQITENGVLDPDGVEQEVDVMICATGFDNSYSPKFPILVNGETHGRQMGHALGRRFPRISALAYAEVPKLCTSFTTERTAPARAEASSSSSKGTPTMKSTVIEKDAQSRR